MQRPDLSVVIVSFNTLEVLRACLTALRTAADGLTIEIIVVDNGSTDGSLDYLNEQGPGIRLIANHVNTGFAHANNRGLAVATAETLLLLNSDAFVTSEALRAALDTFQARPDVGLIGVRLLNPDRSLQAESGRFSSLWDDIATSLGFDQHRPRPTSITQAGPADWVQGACMFVRREALAGVGGLDTTYFMYSEEVDWCRRFWQHGWQVWYLPDTPIVHIGGASSQRNDLGRRAALYRSRILARRRWDGRLAGFALWVAIVTGLAVRVIVRAGLGAVVGRPLGRQSPGSDWQLLRQLTRGAGAPFNA